MIPIIQGYRQTPLALGPQYINHKTTSLKLYTLVTFDVLVAVQPPQSLLEHAHHLQKKQQPNYPFLWI